MRALAVWLTLWAWACSHERFYTGRPAGRVYTGTSHFFLWGLWPSEARLNVGRLCPLGVSSVESYQGPGDAALLSLTSGLYAPRSYRVTCAR